MNKHETLDNFELSIIGWKTLSPVSGTYLCMYGFVLLGLCAPRAIVIAGAGCWDWNSLDLES